ncbi:MAG: AAA family ATPase [Silvibacterium sp.]
MFHSFYQIREQPFDTNPDPRFLYLSRTHREAFSSLLYRVQMDSGFLAMVAPPGMGKTMLLFHLLHRLQTTAKTAFVFQTQCTSHELLQHLLSEFECDTSITDPVGMYRELKSFLLREANADRRCILVIDEAQNLHPDVLETLRLLSNFETPRRKLLQIILSGQSELDGVLARPELRQLRQRLSCIIHIDKFTPEETALYIAHRLSVAGYEGKLSKLFSMPALTRIAQLSEGIPRVINNICFNALSLGFALEFDQVDLDIIDEVANDLGLSSTPYVVPQNDHPSRVAVAAWGEESPAYASIVAVCVRQEHSEAEAAAEAAAFSEAVAHSTLTEAVARNTLTENLPELQPSIAEDESDPEPDVSREEALSSVVSAEARTELALSFAFPQPELDFSEEEIFSPFLTADARTELGLSFGFPPPMLEVEGEILSPVVDVETELELSLAFPPPELDFSEEEILSPFLAAETQNKSELGPGSQPPMPATARIKGLYAELGVITRDGIRRLSPQSLVRTSACAFILLMAPVINTPAPHTVSAQKSTHPVVESPPPVVDPPLLVAAPLMVFHQARRHSHRSFPIQPKTREDSVSQQAATDIAAELTDPDHLMHPVPLNEIPIVKGPPDSPPPRSP